MKIGTYEIQVPFVTTSSDHIKTILKFADIKPGMKIIDLGSGDGRMILEFGKHGASATGYEIKSELVEKTKKRIEEANLTSHVFVYNSSFWDVDLSPFDLIYIYGMGSIMGRLEKKIEKECRVGTKIISNVFRFPHLKEKREENFVHLYLLP